MTAAALTIEGQDGMRFLGKDPGTPAGDVERLVMLELHRRIVKTKDRALDDAQRSRP